MFELNAIIQSTDWFHSLYLVQAIEFYSKALTFKPKTFPFIPQEPNQSCLDWLMILIKSFQNYQQVDYKLMFRLQVSPSVPWFQDLWS